MSMEKTTAIDGPTVTAFDETTYRVDHTGPGELSTTLVLALAEVAGVDPVDFQLYTYIDPDALDGLFDPLDDEGTPRGRVHLDILDCAVTIHSTGRIEIRVPESESDDG